MATSLMMGLYGVLLIVLGILLIRRYLATRNVGFLVLAVALVAWPFLLWPLDVLVRSQLDASLRGGAVAYPFTLVTEGRATAGTVVAFISYARESIRLALMIWGFVLLSRHRPFSVAEEIAS